MSFTEMRVRALLEESRRLWAPEMNPWTREAIERADASHRAAMKIAERVPPDRPDVRVE